MFRVVAVTSWFCPGDCTRIYCDYSHKCTDEGYELQAFGRKFTGVEHSAGEWLSAFKAQGTQHIEFTGGEPLAYEGWYELTARLPVKWALTSSLYSLEAINGTCWKNCTSVTGSLHEWNSKEFIDNARYVQTKVEHVRVTIVARPDYKEEVLFRINLLTSLGLKVNIHPILKMDFKWSEKDWEWVQGLDTGDNKVLVVRDIPNGFSGSRLFPKCDAGNEYLFVDADMLAYKCYSSWLHGPAKSIGILGCITPVKKQTPCDTPCVFPCDINIARKSGNKV